MQSREEKLELLSKWLDGEILESGVETPYGFDWGEAFHRLDPREEINTHLLRLKPKESIKRCKWVLKLDSVPPQYYVSDGLYTKIEALKCFAENAISPIVETMREEKE